MLLGICLIAIVMVSGCVDSEKVDNKINDVENSICYKGYTEPTNDEFYCFDWDLKKESFEYHRYEFSNDIRSACLYPTSNSVEIHFQTTDHPFQDYKYTYLRCYAKDDNGNELINDKGNVKVTEPKSLGYYGFRSKLIPISTIQEIKINFCCYYGYDVQDMARTDEVCFDTITVEARNCTGWI